MWTGDYKFFDYKYNIEGYNGQDYMSPIQYIMCGIALLIVFLLLIIFRKDSKAKAKKVLLILGIVVTSLYLIKTTWESYFDITTGRGFNTGILPFDLCSLIMPALLIAGLSKKDSKLETFAATFISTCGFAGGVSNMIFLMGLKYYPMFTFGALYSLFWHALMIFASFYVPVTKFHEFKWIDILNGMVFVLVASLVVLPYDYIAGADFMLINGSSGVPVIENIAEKLIDAGLRPLATLTMFVAYLLVCALMVSINIGIKKLNTLIKNKKAA